MFNPKNWEVKNGVKNHSRLLWVDGGITPKMEGRMEERIRTEENGRKEFGWKKFGRKEMDGRRRVWMEGWKDKNNAWNEEKNGRKKFGKEGRKKMDGGKRMDGFDRKRESRQICGGGL
jgi:hypothetical protein